MDSHDPPVTAVAPSEKPQGGRTRLLLLLIAGIVLVIGLIIWLIFGRSQTVTVPNVTGITVQEAVSELEQADLTFGNVVVMPSVGSSGTINAQNPGGDNEAEAGTEVNVRVEFQNPDIAFEVPGVRGQAEDTACQLVREAGLVCEVRLVESEAQAGRVIGQSPSAGEQLDIGATVTITVSTGP